MMFGLRLPFQRRRTRWEQLRDALVERAELSRRMQEAQRLREALPDTSRLRASLPDPTDLARRAQPLVDRMAAVWPEVALPETPDFLQAGIDRLSGALARKKPSTTERVLNAEIPLWLALGIGVGAFVAGCVLGQAAAAQRRSPRPVDLERAADQIKERWPAIHDDDIREAKGNLKRLSSVVSERTGESARDVRERLVAMTTGQSANGGSSSNGGSAPS
jgi:hypothetical protein